VIPVRIFTGADFVESQQNRHFSFGTGIAISRIGIAGKTELPIILR
jgi:hypothetical protein